MCTYADCCSQVKLINPQEVSLNLGVLSDDTDFPKWSDQVGMPVDCRLTCRVNAVCPAAVRKAQQMMSHVLNAIAFLLQDKLSLLWKLQCPPVHPFCVDVNFWSHALEYAPDPGTLVQTMNKAKSLWVEGQRTCNAEV